MAAARAARTRGEQMLGWLGKMFLFRILPRRILPVLAVIEIFRMFRGARNQRGPGSLADRGGRSRGSMFG
jgi:hypothetical protein